LIKPNVQEMCWSGRSPRDEEKKRPVNSPNKAAKSKTQAMHRISGLVANALSRISKRVQHTTFDDRASFLKRANLDELNCQKNFGVH